MITTVLALVALQTPRTMPGVTVRVWDLGDPIDRFPTVREGQPANAYYVADNVDLKTQIESQEGAIKENFVGEVRAWLEIKQAGSYRFRLSADDGAKLILADQTYCETNNLNGFKAEDEITLKPGLHPIRIPFFQKKGNFYVNLSWRPPGATELKTIPREAWHTEPGQTFVVAPGPKKWYYGIDPNRPGDGRPEEDVHPSMTLENFRGPDFKPPVGAMAFLPDGRLAIATWDPSGSIYFLSNLDGPGPVKVHQFAKGLGEPLGLLALHNKIYVTQKEEVTELLDIDGDDVADIYRTVASGWPASQNYHEFTFNLVHLNDRFYVSTSVPLKSGVTNYSPGSRSAYAHGNGPGSIIEITNDGKNTWRRYARGARTPNGMNIGFDGGIYFCDNQGAWMPASRMNLLREGGFYAHQETPDGKEPSDPPVVWFPHGEIGNSPTEMVIVPDGPFKRQMLVGDVTHGGIKRVFVERVGTGLQGAVFRFSEGIEGGVNRLVWGPDGCLYVGCVGADGDWNHKGTKFGLQRLRPNGKVPFEMHKVESVKDGFEVTFSKRPGAEARDPKHWTVRQWRYEPTVAYGGAKLDEKTLPIKNINLVGNRAHIQLEGMKPGHVVYLRMRDIKSAEGELAWVTESWYTLNQIADRSALAPLPEPIPFPQEKKALNAEDFQHANGSPIKWKAAKGELIVDQAAGHIITKEKFEDCFLHLEWLSPPGGKLQLQGNSGVKLQERYEVQILGNPTALPGEYPIGLDLAGAIYNYKVPDFNASFGPGVWQTYDIKFTAARWQNGRKTQNARMTVWLNGMKIHNDVELKDKTGASPAEAPGPHPIQLQAHESRATGPVRFRNIWVSGTNSL